MRRPLCVLCLVFVLMLALILHLTEPPPFSLDNLEGNTITVTGKVTKKELTQDKLVIYLSDITFSGDSANGSTIKKETSEIGAICYLLLGDEQPKLGAFISVSGKARHYEDATNPGGFSTASYYRKMGYDFFLTNCSIESASLQYDYLLEFLSMLRQKASSIIRNHLSEENASVLNTILLGDKAALDDEVKWHFSRNGIAHILTISGLHISILGFGLFKLLRRIGFGNHLSSGISLLIILLYTIMVGGGSSTCRALIMLAVRMLGIVLKQSYDMVTAMALAAVIVCCIQPTFLYQQGFQMSFGAIMGIGLLQPMIVEMLPLKNTFFHRLLAKLLSGFGIFLAIFPLLLNSYFGFSIFSAILNLVVLPFVPTLLTLGSALIVTGVSKNVVSQIVAKICEILLDFFDLVCRVSEMVPGSFLVLGQPDPWQIIAYYLMLILAVFLQFFLAFFHLSCSGKKLSVIRFALLSFAIGVILFRTQAPLEITTLDVGQGDGICIQTPDKKCIFIDGGSSSTNALGEYCIEPFLLSQGIDTVDYLFISHFDSDHYNGWTQLLENMELGICKIQVENIIIGKSATDHEEFLSLAEKCGIPVYQVEGGEKFSFEELEIAVLCEGESETGSANENSIVQILRYQNFTMLFTGDIEKEAEEILTERLSDWKEKEEVSQITILKVAHHGSMYSTSENILKVANPEYAVISCGKNNFYGHPHAETLERLNQMSVHVISTMDSGAFTIKTDGTKMQLFLFTE